MNIMRIFDLKIAIIIVKITYKSLKNIEAWLSELIMGGQLLDRFFYFYPHKTILIERLSVK